MADRDLAAVQMPAILDAGPRKSALASEACVLVDVALNPGMRGIQPRAPVNMRAAFNYRPQTGPVPA